MVISARSSGLSEAPGPLAKPIVVYGLPSAARIGLPSTSIEMPRIGLPRLA
jgi:hypothetical protein